MRISDWSSDVCSSDLAEFGRPHRDDLAVPHHLVRHRIEFDVGIAQHLAGERGAQAAQHRLDARDEFARAERFGDIIVGAGLEAADAVLFLAARSEEHTSELQSLLRISYAVFCLKKKTPTKQKNIRE